MQILIQWVLFSVAILVSAYLVPGVETTVQAAFVLAIVLGLINAFIRPIISLLTLPLTILTLGLFSFVVNALLVMLADSIVPGFSISGFWIALVFSVVLALVGYVLRRLD